MSSPAEADPPALTMSPDPVEFGGQQITVATAPVTVTLSNDGPDPVGLTGFEVQGADAGLFSLQDDTCGTELVASAACTVAVVFTPSTVGAFTATLAVGGDAPDPLPFVVLQGVGEDHSVGVDVTSVPFPDQRLSTTSAASQVILTNNQPAAFTLSASVTGADAGDFGTGGTCGQSIDAGASCVVEVTFTPGALGPRTAGLSITSDDPQQPAQSIPLSGTGVEPVAGADPGVLGFGDLLVGTTSGAQTVTVANTGTGPLTITSLALDGPDADQFQTTSTCPPGLPAGGDCTAGVTFAPTRPGAKSASLTLISDGSPSPLQVALSGRATQPAILLEPAVLAFGDQELGGTSEVQTIIVRNPGTHRLSVGPLNLAGSDAASFAVTASTCDTPVAPGGSCAIRLTFTPGAESSRTARLIVPHDGPGGSVDVLMSGTGTAPSLALSATSVDFGQLAVGGSAERIVTISNPGTAALRLTGVSVAGTDAAQFAARTPCSVTPAGASCEVTISVTPNSPGPKSARLRVRTTAGTQDVSLSATALRTGLLKQTPVRRLRLATTLRRGTWTQLLALPVRTNAQQYIAVTITPQRRVDVRQYRGKLEVKVLGGRKARITVSLAAPAADGFTEYSLARKYRVKAR